ncbi:hypothetical protein LSTR_LSTR014671 [Laodelphax striatellus]|uniref:Uncharacterized protein n=1 Tax=Laodelphax striatellus TaxID=195883 RepID=A0A482X066_LAOST|nr:hypothetical protein LSTR_LSTR014671 [Laodelphax striatellus]
MVPTTNNKFEATKPELKDEERQLSGANDHQLSTFADSHGNPLPDDETCEISDAGRRAMLEYVELFVQELINDEVRSTIAVNPFSVEEEMISANGNESFNLFILDENRERVVIEPFWEIYIILAMILGIVLNAIYYFPDNLF